jgi:hypothetical protein
MRRTLALVLLISSVLAWTGTADASPPVFAGEQQSAVAEWRVPLRTHGTMKWFRRYFVEADRWGNPNTGGQTTALSEVDTCRENTSTRTTRCRGRGGSYHSIPDRNFRFDFMDGTASLTFRHDGTVDRVAWHSRRGFVENTERGDWGFSASCYSGFPGIVYGYSAGPASVYTVAAGIVKGQRLDRTELVWSGLSDEAGASIEEYDVPVVAPLPCILVVP